VRVKLVPVPIRLNRAKACEGTDFCDALLTGFSVIAGCAAPENRVLAQGRPRLFLPAGFDRSGATGVFGCTRCEAPSAAVRTRPIAARVQLSGDGPTRMEGA